jgi:hypothetical protein
MRFIFAVFRIIVFVASIIMTLAVTLCSFASVAIWLFLTFGGRDVSIHGLHGELPSRLNGLVFKQADSTHYLVGSLILLFVILPLSLALMERFYFGLYAGNLELEEEAAAPTEIDEAEQPTQPLPKEAQIPSPEGQPPVFD